jgi:hypothetical protein
MTRFLLFVALALTAGIRWHGAGAQERAEHPPLTATLNAVTVSLTGEPGSNIYRTIWRDLFDRELVLRQTLSERTRRPPILTTDVFAAAFDVTDGKIVVSATDTGDGCLSYTNLGLPPSLMTCPMRVALVRNREPKIIYSSDSFPFSIGVTSDGKFDSTNPQDRPAVTLDPATKILSTRLFEGGQPAGPHIEGFNPRADDSLIHLEY